MFLFQHPGWLDQLRVPGNENWHRIAGTEWLQLLQEQPEVVLDLVERDLGVVVEDGNEVLRRQPFAGESIEPRPQLGNLLHRKRTTHGVRVSAKTGEQLRARFQRLQQMERLDGASRTMRFAVFAGEDERRTPIALHNTRGANADHAAMPAFALQHQAVSLSHLGRGFNFALNFVQDALLFLLPVAVELIEPNGYLRRFGCILLGEQLDDVLGHVHAAGGVQARRYAEGDVAGAQRCDFFKKKPEELI